MNFDAKENKSMLMNKTQMTLVSVIIISCLFLTSCAPWTVTLMNQIVVGTVGAINLAAAINHKTPDQSLIDKANALGNGFIQAYKEWEAATPNLKPGAWAKVQEAMTLVQKDLPPILTGLGVKDSAYIAVADFVISEILSLSSTITGTSAAKAASYKTISGHATLARSDASLDPKKFKQGYNDKMRDAGHPEFCIK